jgi:hypothetical protein
MPVIANLADEIIRLVEINRRTINGLDYGILTFRVFKGQPVEITASQTIRISDTAQLCPLHLKMEEG